MLRSNLDRVTIRQFGSLSASRLSAAGASFALFAIASRQLQAPELGELALILSVGAMMTAVADGGLVLVLNESVAKELGRGRGSFLLVLRRRLALAVLASVGTAVLYLSGSAVRDVWVPLAYSLSLLASVCYSTATAALRGAGLVSPDAVNEVASRLALLGLGSLALSQGVGVLAVVILYALVDSLSALCLIPLAWRRLDHRMPADTPSFGIRRVLPLGLAAIVGLAYYRIDLWLIGVLTTGEQVAFYAVCVRLFDGLMIPAGVLAVIVVGSTAQLSPTAARKRVDRMALGLGTLLSPFIIALTLFPEQILTVAFGAGYGESASALRILALSIIPMVAGLAWSPLVMLRGNGLLSATVTALTANVAFNLALIPTIGIEGAALATVISQVLYVAQIRVGVRRLEVVAACADGVQV